MIHQISWSSAPYIQTTKQQQQQQQPHRMVLLDYEYIPNDDKNANNNNIVGSNHVSDLSSSYPAGTPAGLRGEAVRSALRSGRCITWRGRCCCCDGEDDAKRNLFGNSPLVLHGPGCLDFLNNQLSQKFEPVVLSPSSSSSSYFRSAALLSSKGRLIDILGVAVFPASDGTTQQQPPPRDYRAYLLPSPGHESCALWKRLDRYIFPLDQVELTTTAATTTTTTTGTDKKNANNVFQFTLASVHFSHVQRVWNHDILPRIWTATTANNKNEIQLDPTTCVELFLGNNQHPDDDDNAADAADAAATGCRLLVFPTVFLPNTAAVGCTLVFWDPAGGAGSSSSSSNSGGRGAVELGRSIWEFLISSEHSQGPIEIQSLEYESLRIEAGQPQFGYEITGHFSNKNHKQQQQQATTATTTPASPLELFLQEENCISFQKGCYMGQEGIASMLKNSRGPPRQLYQVIFKDEFNLYDYQTTNDNDITTMTNDNQTRIPVVGDILMVLGSNDKIVVGTITSVAEPGSMGEPNTVALAFIKRPDGILRQMKELELEWNPAEALLSVTSEDDGENGSGMILPPPKDPLHGLEVIVQGSYAIGTLQSIPRRRLAPGTNMFVLPTTSSKQTRTRQGKHDDDNDNDDNDEGIQVTQNPWATTIAQQQQQQQQPETTPSKTELEDSITSKDNMTTVSTTDGTIMDQATTAKQEAAAAAAEAEQKAAAAEAERKAAKLELLKQRAEQAMARRQQNQQQQQQQQNQPTKPEQ